MIRGSRKFYFTTNKPAPLSPAYDASWYDLTQIYPRFGLTWDTPGGSPFVSRTLSGSSFVASNPYWTGLGYAYSVLGFQCVSDACPFAATFDTSSELILYTRAERITPSLSSSYPRLGKYFVFAVYDASHTLLALYRDVLHGFPATAGSFLISQAMGLALEPSNPPPPINVPAGWYFVLELGLLADANTLVREGPYSGALELGDAAAADLFVGDTHQDNAWGVLSNYLYTPPAPAVPGGVQFRQPLHPMRAPLVEQSPALAPPAPSGSSALNEGLLNVDALNGPY